MKPHSGRQVRLGDWTWNAVLYTLAFTAIAVATVTAAYLVPALDETPLSQGPLDLIVGRAVGMAFYWLPGVLVALAVLALVFRFVPPARFRIAAVTVPILVVGGWIAVLANAGVTPTFLGSPFGWVITGVALLAGGLATRVPADPATWRR